VRPAAGMPLLKLADNPPMLSPAVDSLADMAGRWWVAHTKARNEKALAWDLLRREISYFLPMRHHIFFSGGRRRHGLLPLFTSYLFFCGDEQARRLALATNRVCRVLDVPNQQRLIGELAAIQRALAAKADLELYPRPAVGERCRVRAGPFLGIEGVVVERRTRARLVLDVHLIQQGAALEVDADLLEPTG